MAPTTRSKYRAITPDQLLGPGDHDTIELGPKGGVVVHYS